jgi:hypothetical protein
MGLVSSHQTQRLDLTNAELLSFLSSIGLGVISESLLPLLQSEEASVHVLGTLDR